MATFTSAHEWHARRKRSRPRIYFKDGVWVMSVTEGRYQHVLKFMSIRAMQNYVRTGRL